MHKRKRRYLQGACLTLLAGGFFTLMGSVAMAADSSCVTCHTDEDMLLENLAQVKAKKSAMQSGAG